jgi:ferredoxin
VRSIRIGARATITQAGRLANLAARLRRIVSVAGQPPSPPGADGLRKRCVADYLCGKESTGVADSSTTNPTSRTSPLGGFTVELARSGREFFIPEGSRILEVLLDEGIDVDFSCELGICGACEQRVISGIPEHHDSILSEEEQAENKRVMICCAGCKTDRLVLDL